MNNFIAVLFYLVVSGVFLGYSVKQRYEVCGIQKVTTKDIKDAMYWPIVAGMSFIVDKEMVIFRNCDEPRTVSTKD